MTKTGLLISTILIASLLNDAAAADLPVREVILYKHGVGYFERSGELKAGETARLDFKADDMNDVLKSLTVTDRAGGKIGSVRYDASETIEKRLEDFPFATGGELSMAAFLDRMKGAQVELKLWIAGKLESLDGAIVSARVVKDEKGEQAETLVILTGAGELRMISMAGVQSVKFGDVKLQNLLKDYLGVLGQAHSKDRRSIYIDAQSGGVHELFARYMTPAAVWKSSYRLLFGTDAEPMLEGWAIVDNTSGEDWSNVKLSVVSGKPISFITQLYEPRYVIRPHAELAENQAVGPQVFDGAIGPNGGVAVAQQMGIADRADSFSRKDGTRLGLERPAPMSPPSTAGPGGFGGGVYKLEDRNSSISTAEGREAADLFEYSFAGVVTVKKGESAMLPFLQQKLKTRKLLIYSENFGVHAMDAAEITNTTGKTLDGGPITVYDAGSYAGEALVETIKAGDKRLISYGVDLGTRITTKFDSSNRVVREIHVRRGVLVAKSAIAETKTYTIKNVDAKAKLLIIEHPQRYGYKLIDQTPAETTANAYRFEVKLGPSATETFAVKEERVYDEQVSISSLTGNDLTTWILNKSLSDAGRRQLEQIAAKKREIAANQESVSRAQSDISEAEQDERRTRENIGSLRTVTGQDAMVQQYARQLATIETKLAGLRDTQAKLRTTKSQLDSELAALMEKIDF